MGAPQKRRALISVTDKSGLDEFAASLMELGFEILSTGGTAKFLQSNGITVTEVSSITEFPEIMDGRVKTLHPAVHGGLLMDRNNPLHLEQASTNNIQPIDLVVVNLYQFEHEAIAKGLPIDQAIEHIDIGGPAMLRAAAKNHQHVAVVIDPADYSEVSAALQANDIPLSLRVRLASKVFQATAAYDQAIASYLSSARPDHTLHLSALQNLRYGENPHQKAKFLWAAGSAPSGLASLTVLQGKELSYNNYLDIDAAAQLVADLPADALTIVKHNTPCGVAASREASVIELYQRALSGDPVAAFGGIVATSKRIDEAAARAMNELFLECIVAPDFDDAAREVFSEKKNLRLIRLDFSQFRSAMANRTMIRSVVGGYLMQDSDDGIATPADCQLATLVEPSEAQTFDLQLAMAVAKHVKSNAIVLVKDGQTIGIGGGQVSRIDAAKIAFAKAHEFHHDVEGAVLASDAFFPFRDTIDLAASHGVTAVIQPGGSVRDQESIDACNEHQVAMLFTGRRHFRH